MPPAAEGFASRHLLGPALRTQPDRRLVTLVREGYEVAFEEIVRRYGRPLTRYAASIVGSRSEDVTQDAFSKALLALRRDDTEIELRPWLFRIVRNTALNDLRDSPPTPELLAEALAGGENPAEQLEHREELADLMKRLQALPEPQRAAIVMRELEGLGHEEIAAALGMTGGAARQAIYRARRALRNGAGMLLPLPLLKLLLAGAGPTAAEAAVGAGVGGTAGAGVALKATAATVLVAGAVGTGAVIDQASKSGNAGATPPPAARKSTSSAGGTGPPATASSGDDGGSNEGHGSGGEDEDRDDHSGKGRSGDGRDDSSGPGERSGHGGGDEDGGDDRGGQGSSGSGHSGPGHGGSGEDLDDGEDRSGSNSGSSGSGSRSGHSGSGSSGSGSSGSGSDDFEVEDDGSSSGSGSGGELLESSSGSSGSGSEPDDDGDSSGSGSGGSGEDEPDDD